MTQGRVWSGEVVSDATAHRCVERLDAGMLSRIRDVRAAARALAWGLAEAPRRVILDIDVARLLSASITCRLQRRSLFAYLADVLTAQARGNPIPLLT